MTLPNLRPGHRMVRRDGESVVPEVADPNDVLLYAAGNYYAPEPVQGCYPALNGINRFDIVPPEPLNSGIIDLSNDILDAFGPASKTHPKQQPAQRTINAWYFSEKTFCAAASDGTNWYLTLGETKWKRLPTLPQS
jgi:hypothetical protein